MSLLSLGEFHRFSGVASEFVYLVPSGGIFELDALSKAVLERVSRGPAEPQEIAADVAARGFDTIEVLETIKELFELRALRGERAVENIVQEPPADFPLQTLVINLTNQCNLSCQYCYEFGEDKVATPDGKPKFMDWETAKASVDYLIRTSAGRKTIHITFFGGETLMNFALLKRVVVYAREETEKTGQTIDFSLTTNGTLLSPAIIEFLAAECHRRDGESGRTERVER